MRRRFRWIGQLLPLLLLSLPVWAQVDSLEAPPAFAILAGEIRDRDTNQPVALARITAGEGAAPVVTDAQGRYTVAGLSAGMITVLVQAEGYIPLVVTDVELQVGQVRELSINLIADLITLEEFVVSATMPESETANLLIIRSQAIEFSDALGRDLFDRAAVSTAAAALRFVVGASVSEGKYAVVRGLSDRYTSTVLDGLPVPSADPDKRAVQVDMFPAKMIEELNVSKTFTPDQPADATGGRVNIITRALPEGTFFDASVGFSYAEGTTGNDRFPTYDGAGTRFLPLGADVRGRALPTEALVGLPNGPYDRFFSTLDQARAFDRATRAFVPVMGARREAPGPGNSQSLAGGTLYSFADGANRLGVMGAFSRRQEFDFQEGSIRRRYTLSTADGAPDARQDYLEDRGVDEVLWNLFGAVGLALGTDHDLSLLGFYNMAAEDETRVAEQRSPTLGNSLNQALVYQQRQLFGGRLRGEHRFEKWAGLRVDWTVGHTKAAQYQPDTRFFRNTFNPTTNQAFLTGQFDGERTQRIFRNVEDFADLLAVNVRLDLPWFGDRRGELKVGGLLDDTDREYQQRIFTYRIGNNASAQRFGTATPTWTDYFLDDDRIGLADQNDRRSMRWFLYELAGRDAPDYDGRQKIEAAYVNAEIPVLEKLTLTAGVRAERTLLTSQMNSSDGTINRVARTDGGGFFVFFGAPEETGNARIQQTDYLPAVSLRWEIRPGLQLRASYGQTIGKPTFKELVPVITRKDAADVGFVGNPELKLVESKNWDLRLEWFPADEEVIAVSVFRKDLKNPIERLSFNQALEDFETVVNFDEGQVQGVEAEFRRSLSFLRFLGGCSSQFSVGTNFTWLDSAVTVPSDQRIAGLVGEDRRLFNQPAYLANVNLIWDHPDRGWSAGVFYTREGETVVSGAAQTEAGITPGLVDEERVTLDFNLKKTWGRLSLAFSAKNLLDPEVRRSYDIPSPGDWLFSSYRRGRSYSLTASVNF